MIPERLIDEAILAEQIAGEIADTEQQVRLAMMASRLRHIADDIAQMPVYVPPLRLVRDTTVIRGPWADRAEGVA